MLLSPAGLAAPPGPAPLIVTLALRADDQAAFDRLRTAHFPPERNLVPAHVTLFHHLPGGAREAIRAELGSRCLQQPAFPVEVSGVRSLGSGTAFTLASPALAALRASLAQAWIGWLGPQDRQAYRPHITVQNKVAPEAARTLLLRLRAEFTPFTIGAEGVLLWHYRDGPWELSDRFAFAAPGARPP